MNRIENSFFEIVDKNFGLLRWQTGKHYFVSAYKLVQMSDTYVISDSLEPQIIAFPDRLTALLFSKLGDYMHIRS